MKSQKRALGGWAVVFTALVAVCATAGCRKRSAEAANYPQTPGMNGNRYANLVKLAANSSKCAAEDLEYEYVEQLEDGLHLHRMNGVNACEKSVDFLLECFGGVCTWYEGPKKRAAFDLSCDESELTATYLGTRQYGIEGCGQKVTYLLVDDQWIANVSAAK